MKPASGGDYENTYVSAADLLDSVEFAIIYTDPGAKRRKFQGICSGRQLVLVFRSPRALS